MKMYRKMKKTVQTLHRRLFGALWFCALVALVLSCGRNGEVEPSVDFMPYISAYTGGMVGTDASIRVVLAQDMEVVEIGKAIEDELFSFKPKLNGKAYWRSNNTIEFVPDSGALKQGKNYLCRFNLSKIMEVDKKLKHFDFSFRVQKRDFIVEMSPLEVGADNPDKVKISGMILFNEALERSEVEKMISVKGCKEPIRIVPNGLSDSFKFVIDSISKTSNYREIQLTLDGGKIGVDEKQMEKVLVPPANVFQFLGSTLLSEPENGVRLVFSEPVSSDQDLHGLVELVNVASYVVQANGNRVDLFFENTAVRDSLSLRIAKSLESVKGHQLDRTTQLNIKVKPLSPKVALMDEGVILPNTKEIRLNFKAVSLNAVDVEVVRIYQDNILSFLQVNRLDDYEGIRRAGRLVCRKKLLLNPNPATVNSWHNYAIDLDKLFRQEEGAMYRVRISFRQEYASAPFNRALAGVKKQGNLQYMEDSRISAEQEAEWDKFSYYSEYYYDIDWENYDWRDRDNPYTASYYMENNSVGTNLLASNLGLTVKGNDAGDYWAIVNDILEASPVRGATVTLYNLQLRELVSGRTDGDGTVSLKTAAKPFIAVASKGKQKTYLRMVEGENNSYSRFDVGGERLSKGTKGFIYGERGVWRPGDTLFLTFILEDKEGRIPSNHPVSLELFNPQGQFVLRKLQNHGTNGFYTFTLPTQADAPTGLWHAYVKVGQAVFHKALRIETIKPNRLKIDFELASSQMRSGKMIPATLKSAWLTGLVASNLQADVEMTLSKIRSPFKGYEQYEFVNPLVSFSSQTQQVYEGKLSDRGEAQFQIRPMDSENFPGKLNAHFVCRVAENGGDVSVVTKSYPLSPYATYVGIRSNLQGIYRYIETNTDHQFDVVTVSENGKLVNCNSLEYFIYKIGWSYWWENEEEALSNYVNSTNSKVVRHGKLATQNGKAVIPFRVDYPEWGKYLIFVKDTKGGHATACLVNVDWPSWMGNPDSENPSAINMLPFSLDKISYQLGEEVLVTIPKINSGVALISVENASQVLLAKRVPVSSDGVTSFRFKVTEKMSPNAYVQVTVLQPHRNTVDHKPIRMYGVEPFSVSDKNSELHPQIKAPTVARPQTPFTVSVKEQNGRPMTYTLAVVDEGLLGITNFKTPNPWAQFHAKEALGIRTWDMYNYIVGAFAGKYANMFSVGGDDNLELAPNKANRFKPVVRFMGPFTLKKGETKNHRITLPLYIGAVRVMVVAGQDGAYGNAEKEITVRTPLMLLSSLPRTLSVNETIELPVNVFAMEPSVKQVKVQVTTTGKAKVKGSAVQQVVFKKEGDQMVYFTLETGSLEGTEKIVITATGNGHSAKEEVEIAVRNPNPMLSTTQTMLLSPGDTSLLTYQFERQAKENLLQLEVSKLPSICMEQQYQFLGEYGHACSEQLVSKALPLLYASLFQNLSDAEKKQNEMIIKNTIGNLYGRQQASGGFAYWEGNRIVSDWLTSYVGHFFILAKENGYEVQPSVFDKWLSYQRKAAQNWQEGQAKQSRYSLVQSDLEQAYRLYTLALAGHAETGAMNRLRGYSGISQQARWRLAAAYAVAGKRQTALALVTNIPSQVADYTSSNSTFGSSLRDEAMILETMTLLGRDKEAFLLARQMAEKIRQQDYYSTHSSAYTILAFAQLYGKVSKQLAFEWVLNGQPQAAVRSAQSVFNKRLPLKPMSGKVSVCNKGDGQLYVSLYRRTRPLVDTAAAQNRMLSLQVSYTDMSGRALDVAQLRQGTDFMVHIRVTNTQPAQAYNNVALTYILPSGWEVVQASPWGETDSNAAFDYQDVRDDRVLTYFDLRGNSSKVFNLRLRASYCGQFQLPAVKCEAMYDPQAYARTAAGKSVVYR